MDKNASLEEEYRKVAAFKPLMESYKNQIADLESKTSLRTQEIESLKFELEQSLEILRVPHWRRWVLDEPYVRLARHHSSLLDM